MPLIIKPCSPAHCLSCTAHELIRVGGYCCCISTRASTLTIEGVRGEAVVASRLGKWASDWKGKWSWCKRTCDHLSSKLLPRGACGTSLSQELLVTSGRENSRAEQLWRLQLLLKRLTQWKERPPKYFWFHVKFSSQELLQFCNCSEKIQLSTDRSHFLSQN